MTYITADDVERANQSTIGTLLPGPSGVNLDIVLNPLTLPDCGEGRGPPGDPLRDRPRVDPREHLPHPRTRRRSYCIFNDPALIPPDLDEPYDYDPDKAKQLLAGRRRRSGLVGHDRLRHLLQDPGSLAAMTAIQANLAEVGIQVEVQQMDSASWTDRYYGKGASPTVCR